MEMNVDDYAKEISELLCIPVSRISYTKEKVEVQFHYSQLPLSNFLAENLPQIPDDALNNDVRLYVYQDHLYYGFVRYQENDFFLFGPVVDEKFDNYTAQQLLKSLHLPITMTSDFLEYYENTPHYSTYRISQILAFFYNTVKYPRSVIAIDIYAGAYNEAPISATVSSNQEIPIRPDEVLSNIVKNNNYEQQLYSFVCYGQYEQIQTFLQNSHYGETQRLSASAMRQNKYLVITSIALASRAAVQGGLNYNTATQLSDEYYRKVDEALTFHELFNIHRNMLLTYTKLVADRKLGKPALPMLLQRIQHYIELHITEKITTEDIARELKVGRSYLSTMFKKEVGMNLGEYINRLKIDEAKRMMHTTDKTLTQIASTLDYATQSHFIEVFKRLEGITPTEYMKKN